jgi:hypothetical protein
MSFAFMRRFAFVDVGLPDVDTYGDLCLRWLAEELGLRPGEGDLGGRTAFWQGNTGLKEWQPAALAMAMLRAHKLREEHSPRETAVRLLGAERPNDEIAAEAWTAFLGTLAATFATEEDAQAYCDAMGAAVALKCLDRLVNLLARDSILMRRRAIGPAITRDMIRYMARRLRSRGAAIPGAADGDLVALREAFLLYVVPQLDGLDKLTIHLIYADIARLLWEKGEEVGLPPGGEPVEVLKRIRLLYLHVPDAQWPGGGGRSLPADLERLSGEAPGGDGD